MSTAIIAVVNTKGGVGKSTTCKNTGRGFQKQGKLVVLGDTDPQTSLNEWRITDPNSDQPEVVTIANIVALQTEIEKARSKGVDYFILDGMATEMGMAMKLIAVADVVILPLQPSPDDTVYLSDLIELVELNRLKRKGLPKAAFLLNMVDSRVGMTGLVEEALKPLSLPVFKTKITRRAAFINASAEGKTVYDFKGKDYKECAKQIDNLLLEITGMLK
ncbi:hypothetical protein MCAMS1_02869 [biofilm metagenome]